MRHIVIGGHGVRLLSAIQLRLLTLSLLIVLAGCQGEKSIDWGGGMRIEGYQFNIGDFGVLVSRNDNKVEVNGRDVRFNERPLNLELDKHRRVWMVNSDAKATFIADLDRTQMDQLRAYLRPERERYSLDEVLEILRIQRSDLDRLSKGGNVED